ncbi:MAG: HAD hydrolase-like protein [Actinomycetota bacterium]|jgi:2-haloacid dehalogenase|nr:HAD hydrolase-like protein [Actinomycetota bacterium]
MPSEPAPERACRWATFDCYGTLVDWETGIGDQLERLFGAAQRHRLLLRYHEIEPRVQKASPTMRYRDVMARVLAELASEAGRELPHDEEQALARSLPRWPVFREVADELAEARRRGWQLMILSNTDRDLVDASIQAIGVPFSGAIVASEIGSYKPAHGHWKSFYQRTQADPRRHVHVAQSYFHDIVPARELGIRSVWINRLGEGAEAAPTRELPDLRGLPDVLDDLVPL